MRTDWLKPQNPIYKLISYSFLVLSMAISPFFANSVLADEEVLEEKLYEIEIIVFAHQNSENTMSENWSEKPELPQIVNSVELVNSLDLLNDNEIEQLPLFYLEPDFASDEEFAAYIERLSRNPSYDVLAYRTWRQTVPDNSTGIPVYIAARPHDELYQPIQEPEPLPEEAQGEELLDEGIVTAEDIESDSDAAIAESLLFQALEEEEKMVAEMIAEEKMKQLSPFDPILLFDEDPEIPQSNPITLTPMGPPEHQVYGTFKLSKSRFMHMSLDLVYRNEEIISDFTIYPQLIQTDEQIVNSVDNIFTPTEFDELSDETAADTDNSFLIAPVEQIEPLVDETEPLATAEEISNEENFEVDAASTELVELQYQEIEIVDMEPETNSLEGSIYGEEQESFLNPEKPPFIGFRLADSKRVRLSKIYYFDHPMFGVITRVIRYEPPKELAQTEE